MYLTVVGIEPIVHLLCCSFCTHLIHGGLSIPEKGSLSTVLSMWEFRDKGCRMCTDYRALWGKFVISDFGTIQNKKNSMFSNDITLVFVIMCLYSNTNIGICSICSSQKVIHVLKCPPHRVNIRSRKLPFKRSWASYQ